jgi:hypothetical protein
MRAQPGRGIIVGVVFAVLVVSFLVFKQVELWAFKEPAGEIEAFLVAELPKAKQVVIYSLHPVEVKHQRPVVGPPSNRPLLQDWEIFGQVELTSTKERESLGVAFLDSLRLARDERYLCFSPRHGVKIVTADGREALFVLCFECNAVAGYGLPGGDAGAHLANLGQRRLNRLLDKYGIKRDEPASS